MGGDRGGVCGRGWEGGAKMGRAVKGLCVYL